METQGKLPANVYLVEYENGAIAIWRNLTWENPHMVYIHDTGWVCVDGVHIGRYNLRNYEYVLDNYTHSGDIMAAFRDVKHISFADFNAVLDSLRGVPHTTRAFRVDTTAELRAHENKSQ